MAPSVALISVAANDVPAARRDSPEAEVVLRNFNGGLAHCDGSCRHRRAGPRRQSYKTGSCQERIRPYSLGRTFGTFRSTIDSQLCPHHLSATPSLLLRAAIGSVAIRTEMARQFEMPVEFRLPTATPEHIGASIGYPDSASRNCMLAPAPARPHRRWSHCSTAGARSNGLQRPVPTCKCEALRFRLFQNGAPAADVTCR